MSEPGNGHPDLTPPHAYREEMTMREVQVWLQRLEQREADTYGLARSIQEKLDKLYLVTVDTLGEFARMLKERKP